MQLIPFAQNAILLNGRLTSISPAQIAVANGLCGYWGLDPDCIDSSGGIYDLTGGAAMGTASGTLTAEGQVGMAYNFIPANTANISVPASASFNTGYGVEFSISAWVKPANFTNYQVVANQWDELGNKRQWVLAIFADAKIYLYNCDDGIGTGAHLDSMASASTLSASIFYHLVGTQNAVGKKIYINGKMDIAGGTGIATYQTSSAFSIGRATANFAGAPSYFNGLIDDVRFYNRCIDAGEVMELYMAGLNGRRNAGPRWLNDPMSLRSQPSIRQKHFRFRTDADAADATPTWGANEDAA